MDTKLEARRWMQQDYAIASEHFLPVFSVSKTVTVICLIIF